MNYKTFKQIIKQTIKTIKRGKFRSLFKNLIDSEHRSQVFYLQGVIAGFDRHSVQMEVCLKDIKPGHPIVYPEWVDELLQQIKRRGTDSLPKIDVVYDYQQGIFLVADGNHRFQAMKQCLHPAQKIVVNALVPIVFFK